jgi:hypothetical protein
MSYVKKYKLVHVSNINHNGGKKKKRTKLDNIDIDINNFINNQFPSLCSGEDYIPAKIPAVPRIIVLGDIHGDYELAVNLLKIGKVIDNNFNWIGGNTYVVQVGDQIDRCRPINGLQCDNPATTYKDEPSDTKILKLFTDLHKKAKLSGGAVISLLGNHEIMNSMGNMSYVSHMGIKEYDNYRDPNNPSIEFKNGHHARIHAFKPGNEMSKFMGCTRVPVLIIGSNIFVHAGMVDSLVRELKFKSIEDLEKVNVAIRMWLLGLLNEEDVMELLNGSSNSMFWTRILGNLPPNLNMRNNACSENIKEALEVFKIGSIVVGHTPQSFTYSTGINGTCNNRVWRVDNASSSAFHKFDYNFLNTGQITESRSPQVLEIINDKIYNVLK